MSFGKPVYLEETLRSLLGDEKTTDWFPWFTERATD